MHQEEGNLAATPARLPVMPATNRTVHVDYGNVNGAAVDAYEHGKNDRQTSLNRTSYCLDAESKNKHFAYIQYALHVKKTDMERFSSGPVSKTSPLHPRSILHHVGTPLSESR
jgi:hypothetical protein